MLWYQYRQVPGRRDTMLVADSGGAHSNMCLSLRLRIPDMAKMACGPQCRRCGFTFTKFSVWNHEWHTTAVI